jgi:hypothetical protein
MWLRGLFLDHFWLKLFSLLLAMLVWLAVRANIVREASFREFGDREATRNFTARPVMVMTESGAHPAVRIEPAFVDIAVRGVAQDVERLDVRDVRAFVRIPDHPEGETPAPVHVQLPPDAALVMVSPGVVRVLPIPVATNAPDADPPPAAPPAPSLPPAGAGRGAP